MILCSETSEDCTRVWPSRYLRHLRHTLHRTLRWDGRLVESQEGLETKVGLRADMMLELVSDDLVIGSELCPWSLTVALHVILNSRVEAALMCLDSLRLPSCIRTPHVGSSISVVKATKAKYFLITLHELFS
ncbi:hypothetical protein M9H77_35451 [Catharanthus roseus]|uniref:Uncharacterized protein n=1 Tax=Catharanthus roseus TaxID=4058 RepID=A0ACB9ZP26_CATRO|nr:hypothetical protein M9H77_35451 [Catharanthus roseus]